MLDQYRTVFPFLYLTIKANIVLLIYFPSLSPVFPDEEARARTAACLHL